MSLPVTLGDLGTRALNTIRETAHSYSRGALLVQLKSTFVNRRQ